MTREPFTPPPPRDEPTKLYGIELECDEAGRPYIWRNGLIVFAVYPLTLLTLVGVGVWKLVAWLL
jgi:hypothetical protein